MGTEYIHYGSNKFHSFFPPKNEGRWTKPIGGLWASRTDAKFGWKDWVEKNQFHEDSLLSSFKFTLKDDARVLHIYESAQVDKLPSLYKEDTLFACPNFEQIQKDYDAMELHLSEERFPDDADWTYKSLYYKLYGWDCDCILIFNYKIVQPIISINQDLTK